MGELAKTITITDLKNALLIRRSITGGEQEVGLLLKEMRESRAAALRNRDCRPGQLAVDRLCARGATISQA
jgi:hypothetical protein